MLVPTIAIVAAVLIAFCLVFVYLMKMFAQMKKRNSQENEKRQKELAKLKEEVSKNSQNITDKLEKNNRDIIDKLERSNRDIISQLERCIEENEAILQEIQENRPLLDDGIIEIEELDDAELIAEAETLDATNMPVQLDAPAKEEAAEQEAIDEMLEQDEELSIIEISEIDDDLEPEIAHEEIPASGEEELEQIIMAPQRHHMTYDETKSGRKYTFQELDQQIR